MHGLLFIDTYFIANDPLKHNRTSTRTIAICFMDPGIYTILFFHKILVNIFNITDINGIIVDREIMLPLSSIFKYFPNTMNMVLLRVLCFELMDFYTISKHETVGRMLV